RTTSLLSYIKKRGVSVAVDDFGTGYSSLNYLRLFPIDKLKIDRVFVRDITSDPSAAAIAMSVISMARTLNLSVIAEGVETEDQLRALYHHRCDEIQGFYFSRPQNAEDITLLLQEDLRLDLKYKGEGEARQTLLLVDDEKNVLASLVRALRGEHYEVMTATSANEAFEIMATQHVNVVISDYKMPGMLGTSFLGYVKKLYPETVRIILTGQTDINLIMEAINEVEIFKLLTKPWDTEEICKHIRLAFRHNEIIRRDIRLMDELKMMTDCLQ
ncbi:MAG: EAL domain-containing protein, partial [Gammaproteobacteria bacterium]|nr:EAL domain-containing protein [Gammaproteobacteria bacterium]